MDIEFQKGGENGAKDCFARLPSGHPEAFFEAFANNYCNFADTIRARSACQNPTVLETDFPDVDDGLRGMLFIATVVASSKSKTKWYKMKE